MANIFALFIPAAQPAQAAGEKFAFTSANTITGSGGTFGNDAAFTLVAASERYVNTRIITGLNTKVVTTITNVKMSGSGPNFTGTISTQFFTLDGGEARPIPTANLSGAITVTDAGAVGPGATPAAAAGEEVECDGGPFTWVLCGVILSSLDLVDWIRDNVIVPFLKEPPYDKDENPEAKAAYPIWQSMRNVASAFLILIFFLIIFGTAIGYDNYTIKKILPHLITGAILMPLSWYICVIGIDVGNVLGQGIITLMDPLIGTIPIDFDTGMGKVFTAGATAVGGYVALASGITAITQLSFAVIISVVIALLVAFFTLMVRKVIILMLVVLSPFAFLAYVLPNTEKYFKMWYGNLTRLILMYPLIMMLFEASRLSAFVVGTSGGLAAPVTYLHHIPVMHANLLGFNVPLSFGAAATVFSEIATPIIVIAILYLPMFLIPATWAWAGKFMSFGGSAVSKAGGFVGKRYGKGSDFDKNQSAKREYNNIRRAERLSQNGHGVLGGLARARSGKGNGAFGMQRAGLRGNDDLGRLNYDKAYQDALGTRSAAQAHRMSGGLVNQQNQAQQLQAMTQTALNQRAQTVAGRMALNNAIGTAGGSMQMANDVSDATFETNRKDENEKAAKNRAIAQQGRTGGQVASGDYFQNALNHELEHQVEMKAKVHGELEGELEFDRAELAHLPVGAGMQDARDERLRKLEVGQRASARNGVADREAAAEGAFRGEQQLNTDEILRGQGIDPAIATRRQRINAERLQATGTRGVGTSAAADARNTRLLNRAAAGTDQKRQAAGVDEGKVSGQVRDLTAHGEQSMAQILAAGGLEERDRLAQVRAQRTQRVAVQNSAAGHVSDADTLTDANSEAQARFAQSAGAKLQGIANNQAARFSGDRNLIPNIANQVAASRSKTRASGTTALAQQAAAAKAYNSGAVTDADALRASYIDADLNQAKADAQVHGTNAGLDAEILRLQNEDRAAGRIPRSAEVARTELLRKAGGDAAFTTKDTFIGNTAKAAGNLAGRQQAIRELQQRELAEGRPPINDAEAERRLATSLYSDTLTSSAKSKANSLGQTVGNTEGFQESAIQAEADSLVEAAGRAGTVLSRDDALVRARTNIAKGAGSTAAILGTAAAQSVIRSGAQKARQEAVKSTVASNEADRKGAAAEATAVATATEGAIAEEADRLLNNSLTSGGTPLTPDQARAQAERIMGTPAAQQRIRDKMITNVAGQAGGEAARKVEDAYSNAQATAEGKVVGTEQAEETAIREEMARIIPAGATPAQRDAARAAAEATVRSPAGQARLQQTISDRRSQAQVFTAAQTAAAAINQPFTVRQAQQSAIDRAAHDVQLDAEIARLQAVGPISDADARDQAERNIAFATSNPGADPSITQSLTAAEAAKAAVMAKARQRETLETDKLLMDQKAEVARSRLRISVPVDANDPSKGLREVDGVISNMALSPENRAGLKKAALEAGQKGDWATLLAIGDRLTGSGGGTEEMREIQTKLFGRTHSANVSKDKIEEYKQTYGEDFDLQAINDMFISKVNATSRPDMFVGEDVAYDELSPAKARSIDKRGWKRYLAWYDDRESRRQTLPDTDPDYVKPEAVERNRREVITNVTETLSNQRAREGLETNQVDRMREFAFETMMAPDPADPTRQKMQFVDSTSPAGAPHPIPPGLTPEAARDRLRPIVDIPTTGKVDTAGNPIYTDSAKKAITYLRESFNP